MKKIALLSLLVFSFLFVKSQTKSFAYCELIGTQKLLSTKMVVQVDYGQKTTFFEGVDFIRDENGKRVDFNSMIDAMNFMGTQGWEFVQAYIVTSGQTQVYHWVLKREIGLEEQKKMVEELSE